MAAALRRYRNEITGVALAYKRSAAAMPPLFLTRAAMPPARPRAAWPRGSERRHGRRTPAIPKRDHRRRTRIQKECGGHAAADSHQGGHAARPLARHGRADQSGGMAAALRRYRNAIRIARGWPSVITGVALASTRRFNTFSALTVNQPRVAKMSVATYERSGN